MTTETNENQNSQDEATQKAERSAQELEGERERSTALEAKLQEVADGMKAKLPEALQKLIPGGLSVSEQIDWMNAAAASDLGKKPFVPKTDGKPPATQQQKIDPSELPPVKRIAMAYGAAE